MSLTDRNAHRIHAHHCRCRDCIGPRRSAQGRLSLAFVLFAGCVAIVVIYAALAPYLPEGW